MKSRTAMAAFTLFAALTTTTAHAQSLSADGKQALVIAGVAHIPYIVDLATLKTEPLESLSDARGASWAPDGRHLAVLQGDAGTSTLAIMNLKTRRTKSISTVGGGPFGWREDGKRIAMVRSKQGEPTKLIWFNIDEWAVSYDVKVKSAPNLEMPLQWLHNTDDLAFVGQDGNIHLVEAGEEHVITTTGDIQGMQVMADGKQLVWARRGPNLQYILLSLYAFDLKRRDVKRIAFPERVPTLNPNPQTAPIGVIRVDISPTGDEIAITALQESRKPGPDQPGSRMQAVHLVRMDGSNPRVIARLPDKPGAPSSVSPVHWSGDGKIAAVVLRAGGLTQLVVAEAGAIRAVTVGKP